METKRLKGLVALVTGAGGGREKGGGGAGIARVLARQGATVAVNDLHEEYAEMTVQDLKAMGAEAGTAVGDVSDSAQANRMIKSVAERYGRFDILVNNAAALGRSPAVQRMPDDMWYKFVAINLSGPFFMVRAALPFMKANRYGRIINIASLAGLRVSFNGGACYTASKAGLIGATRQWAVELAEFGITANVITPAGILNGNVRSKMSPETLAGIESGKIPRLMALPEDIGELAAFLASPQGSQINGVTIPVDRGSAQFPGDFDRYKTSGKDVG